MSAEKTYIAGVDVGSTTVKLVLLDGEDTLVYQNYLRHGAQTQQTLADLLEAAQKATGVQWVRARITGSGAINLSRALQIPFVQEVVAVAQALEHVAPQTDVAIELGGEDAKIIYFTGGLEERMNGVCAGGTGAFIDQMAALLQTDADGLNQAAAEARNLYPIAARCGVFAKTDIQPLINEGATLADLAASIFQAVVNQTISGLACGKPIRGNVAFLGGPLHFLPQLKQAFIRSLHLRPDQVIESDYAHLFAAYGAGLAALAEPERQPEPLAVSELIHQLRQGVTLESEIKRLPPLFPDPESYARFRSRHDRAVVAKAPLPTYQGDCYLGVDAGSTTTKLVLIGEAGQLLFSYYAANDGSPIRTAIQAVRALAQEMPAQARIAYSCATGYGEALLQSAFCLDMGEVETIAHSRAAAFFDPAVDCVLDIGGQDMKCIKLKDGFVDTILLNEACSSGCGSFIENFAASLGYTAQEFADLAVHAQAPVDLGTRCTVFMNSNVKQAQKEGIPVADISGGLAYSVIKNALFKVIKLTSPQDLGKHIVVQGGTFHNQAVLRAFESIAGVEAVCPDICGLMGAFGAALLARDRAGGRVSTMLPLEEILQLSYTTETRRCGGCTNHCMLTVNRFPGGRQYISGNRCEKGLGGGGSAQDTPNLAAYKLERIFDYPPLPPESAPRGVIGIPRVLNLYENYPFWATFFRSLGFSVLLSPVSDRALYTLGMESIPSESECYPAKLAHGHVEWLIRAGVRTIFHPCVFYEKQETPGAQNHFNCPMVVAYPENIKNNLEHIQEAGVRYLRPFLALTSQKIVADRLVRFCRQTWNIPGNQVRAAVREAWAEQERAKADIVAEGRRALRWMEQNHRPGLVLAGRPYHMDPEIHHGLPQMIASYGLAVLTEDSLPVDFEPARPLRVNDQWVYHSRLYTAAEFVSHRQDLELIQLNSFGCGLDAVTTDQVCEILQNSNKLYTVLKIDEISNLGAVRIRIRSLLAAMEARNAAEPAAETPAAETPATETPATETPAAETPAAAGASPVGGLAYRRSVFTKSMRDTGYTILAPQMSPIHFQILEPVFRRFGYQVEILDREDRDVIDTGLRYVNNDACFPSITVVGQIMQAALSGAYDVNRLAILMSQTGGCCRASNYISFIRRALDKAGLSQIPVISLNANGMEKNEGFRLTAPLLLSAAKALVYGDLLMRCLYRVRPYEAVPGSANTLHARWRDRCVESLVGAGRKEQYPQVCRELVQDFDALALDESRRKPRVGVVGEILVKYMPLANNHLVDLLEVEGAEAVVPDLMDFLGYSASGGMYKHTYLGAPWVSALLSRLGVAAIRTLRRPAVQALKESRRFDPPAPLKEIARLARPYLSLGNQYGEGWFLTGEMAELLVSGVPNIVCVQPFACLPNHVVGKGVIKALRRDHPEANIVAIDYDPGASQVNQLNRIKLMLSTAKSRLREKPPAIQT